MLVLMTLVWIIAPVLMLSTGREFRFEGGQLIAVVILLAFVGLTLYLAFNLSEVRLSKNEIKFKKIFGPEKVYSFDKIGYPSSFRYKRLKFTSIEMKGASEEIAKYLILNNNALLSGERIDAEEILLSLRK